MRAVETPARADRRPGTARHLRPVRAVLVAMLAVGSVATVGVVAAATSAGASITIAAPPSGPFGGSGDASDGTATSSPVITWSAPSSITYGTSLSATQLDATSSVGGTFAYVPASGAVLAVGTHALTVTFTPSDGGTPATVSASVAITVTPAALTIFASSLTLSYGTTPPAIHAGYVGFVNNETLIDNLSKLPVCTTTATATSPIGEYLNSCSGAVAAGGNYTITYVTGMTTITPPALVITASSPTVAYGTSVPKITPSYFGFVAGQGPSALTTAPVCSTTATASSPAGTDVTTCTGAVDPNYMISYVPGVATISQDPLVITASSPTTTYGTIPPAITASYAGFVNGQSASSLSAPPICVTTASTSTPVGTAETSCSGAVDPNYLISYVPGVATITRAHLVVTASSTTSTSGENPSAVGATYSGFVDGESVANLSTDPTCSSSVNSSTAAGTYSGANACRGAADPNYDITYASGDATVSAAPSATAPTSTTVTTAPTSTTGSSATGTSSTKKHTKHKKKK